MKQDTINKRMNQQLENYLSQYAKRVKAGESPSDTFIDLNQRWTTFCGSVKRPLQRDVFALKVTALNKLVKNVDNAQRKERAWGRFMFWFIVVMCLSWVAGVSYAVWYFFFNQ